MATKEFASCWLGERMQVHFSDPVAMQIIYGIYGFIYHYSCFYFTYHPYVFLCARKLWAVRHDRHAHVWLLETFTRCECDLRHLSDQLPVSPLYTHFLSNGCWDRL